MDRDEPDGPPSYIRPAPIFHAPVEVSQPAAEDTRDRIIQSYRDEIKNHQARERDYQALQQAVSDLQRRTRGVEGEMGQSVRDHEDRIREQNKVVAHLQGELESLKK